MDGKTLKDKITIFRILGKHIEKYIVLFIVIMSFVIASAIGLIVYWNIDNSSGGKLSDTMFLVAYIYLLVISIISVLIMSLNKAKKVSSFGLSIWLHLHVFLMFVWGTVIALLDLDFGISPIGILMISIIIGGVLVVEPIYFTVITMISTIIILAFNVHYDYKFFNGRGEMLNFIAIIVIIIILAYRNYHSIIRDYRAKERLEELTYYDDLTGLLNERSYMIEIDKLNKEISLGHKVEFGIVLMDVNNLKVTNDTYGHHYGCHLIVRCGHILPTIFKTSKCFHVGGDEFIVILQGDDLKNHEEIIKEFDKTLRYSHITYEEVDLIFSVARGYAIYKGGSDYKETFNKADKQMYENKQAIKTEYNMKGR